MRRSSFPLLCIVSQEKGIVTNGNFFELVLSLLCSECSFECKNRPNLFYLIVNKSLPRLVILNITLYIDSNKCILCLLHFSEGHYMVILSSSSNSDSK